MRESSFPPKQHKEAVRTAEGQAGSPAHSHSVSGQPHMLTAKQKDALFVLLLALLVCNRAGSFAGGLAGSLALAAAGMRRSIDAGLLNGLNVFHWNLSSIRLE